MQAYRDIAVPSTTRVVPHCKSSAQKAQFGIVSEFARSVVLKQEFSTVGSATDVRTLGSYTQHVLRQCGPVMLHFGVLPLRPLYQLFKIQ